MSANEPQVSVEVKGLKATGKIVHYCWRTVVVEADQPCHGLKTSWSRSLYGRVPGQEPFTDDTGRLNDTGWAAARSILSQIVRTWLCFEKRLTEAHVLWLGVARGTRLRNGTKPRFSRPQYRAARRVLLAACPNDLDLATYQKAVLILKRAAERMNGIYDDALREFSWQFVGRFDNTPARSIVEDLAKTHNFVLKQEQGEQHDQD